MPAKNKAKPQEIYLNDTLPIIYVDSIHTRHRDDGFNYLSLATRTPYRFVEQVRLMIEDKSLRIIIDDICQTINYYPEKPSKKEKGSSK